MRTLLFVVVLSCSAAVFWCACSDRGAPITLISSASPDNQPISLIVKPDSGRIGTPLSIRDSSFVPRSNYLIAFPGADDVLVALCDSLYTIHTFVPFGAISGRISVSMNGLQGLTQRFIVSESFDTLAVSVAGYDISPPVTPADSSVIDFAGRFKVWQADVSGDSVHLSVRYSPGDDIREIHFILHDAGDGRLPGILSCWTYIKFDYPGSRTDVISTGVLKIQDWSIRGVMSGRFFTRPSDPVLPNGSVAFWVHRSQAR